MILPIIILTLIALLIAGVIGIGIAQMFVWREIILSTGGYRAYFSPWLQAHRQGWIDDWDSVHPWAQRLILGYVGTGAVLYIVGCIATLFGF